MSQATDADFDLTDVDTSALEQSPRDEGRQPDTMVVKNDEIVVTEWKDE